jgi:endonuclease/exonuclease/phosphatase family metal-dependent hydrolase
MQPPLARPHRRRWVLGWGAAGVGLISLGLLVTSTAPSDATHPRDQVASVVSAHVPNAKKTSGAGVDTIRITQANLKSGERAARFQSDVSTVLSGNPDFITYNEVPFRQDTVLAPPPGYAMWRTPGQYQGETPVAWRADEWVAIAHGTQRLSNRKGRLKWQHVDWGIRYANWVTLRSLDGRTVSVISAHLTPVISITEGLQPREVRHLGNLVDTLAAAGPVLVGGDFNMPYNGSSYLRPLFDTFQMVPSYDALGAHFATGDHHGATIDYLFLRQDPLAPVLTFTSQHATELYSDHDAVTADLTWNTAAPGSAYRIVPGIVVSHPNGTHRDRRAVLRTMIQAIDHAPEGAAVHLTTTKLTTSAMVRALNRAVQRGVHVQLIIRARTLSPAAKHFRHLLGHRKHASSFAIGCRSHCRAMVKRRHLAATELLVSAVATTPAVWIHSDRGLTVKANRHLTTAVVTARQGAYDRAFRRFFRLADRPI